jgi:hypothetical protein
MDQPVDIERLLKLRKLTREVANLMTGQLRSHLATLSPLLQPTVVLGEHIRTLQKHTAKGADDALAELRAAYQAIYHKAPFNLQSDFSSPLPMPGGNPEITPVEYAYSTGAGDGSKKIRVTCPLKWVVSYAGTGPDRLRELIPRQADTTGTDLQLCVLHYLVLKITLAKRPGIGRILEALRFPVSVEGSRDFGELPMIHAVCSVSTIRPPDDIIVQSTEISGAPVFEEVVDLAAIARLQDPMREKLMGLVREHGGDLAAEMGA